MIQGKSYVRQNTDGCYRVGEVDISLDSIVIAYQQGYTAETIQQLYPVLTLEEVYGAIAFYLANQEEVDRYLKQQESSWQQARERTAGTPSAVVARLRAISGSAKTTTP
jgi:uncharacterized protein (DUF433 family)